MEKLLELEKRLREAKAELEKALQPVEDKKEEDELEKAGGPNKYGERKQAIAENINREQRAPAVEIKPDGAKTLITPEAQVKAKKDAAAAKKAKFEEEAKARRAEYRKQGLVKFDANGQWSMDNE
jgi:hypothetical protein